MTLTLKPVIEVEVTTTIEEEVQTAEASFAKPAQDVAVVVEESRALSPVDRVMGMIAAASRDPTVDVAKMRELFSLQKDMMAIQAEQRFFEALARIQAKVPRIPKNGIVRLGKGKDGTEQSYNFANWEDMDRLVAPILQGEGFTVTFSEDASDQNGIRWAATWRAFGHSEKNYITLPADNSAGKNPLQARGSTNSYAKRYLTEDFCKLVREGADDDGKRGGTIFITPEQVLELQALAIETNTEESRFLEMMTSEARNWEEIEEKDFARLANALSRKKNQLKARKREDAP